MNDKEIVELLETNGTRRRTALVLVGLKNSDGLTANQLMEVTGLSQPEVCVATVQAYHQGWLRLEQGRRPSGSGRPFYRYFLSRPFCEIVEDIADDRAQTIAGMMKKLHALKAAV